MKTKFFLFAMLSVFIILSCNDDDENLNGAGTVSFTLDQLIEVENATQPLNVNLGIDNFNHGGGTVDVSISGADYGVAYETSTGNANFTITIQPGSLANSFGLTPVDNDTIDGNLNLTITLTNATGSLVLGENSTLQFTILDDDDPLVAIVDFENATGTIQEDDTTNYLINIPFNQASTEGGTITITASGDAVLGTDYSVVGQNASPFTITVPAGATAASFEITAIDNTVFEANKTAVFSIIEVTGGLTTGVTTATTITIENDDSPPNPVIDFSSSNTLTYTEADGTITLNFDISNTTTADATVELTATGTADDSDFNFGGSNSPYSFIIPSGSSAGSVSLTIVDDASQEADETIVLSITNVTGGLDAGVNIQQQTLTITDNDAVVFNYVEDFESGSDLATLGFENILNGQTVDPTKVIELITSAGNFTDVNDFTMPSDNGLNIFYNAGSGTTVTELLDNVLVSPLMNATGNFEVIIDNAYAFKNQNTATITYYYSETYNGSGTFTESEWTVMGTETVANMDADGFGNNDYKQQNFNITTTADFYVAVRISQTIDGTNYRTRWRFDNLKINSL
ncbi:hypothetical protein [Lacinutrix chionoecetis]